MKQIRKLWNSSGIRYLFFGGCTTLVNLIIFYILRKLQCPIHAANFLSIAAAIAFAYIVNARFVFGTKCHSAKEYAVEIIKFLEARLLTMLFELAGVWFLADYLEIQEFASKFAVQFLVIILNYILSKLFVFRRRK